MSQQCFDFNGRPPIDECLPFSESLKLPKVPLCFNADYIVVGVGAAGAVLTRLLSENFNNSVLALEAGANHNQDTTIVDPVYANILPGKYHTQYFTDGTSVPQTDVNNRTFDYIQGKLLGGSSAINGMMYVRGTPSIYEEWQAAAGGDPDWGPAAVYETFKEMENFVNLSDLPSPTALTYHSTEGLLAIRLAPTPASLMAEKFANAVQHATGFPTLTDYNDPNSVLGGLTQWQLYQHSDRSRSNSAYDYLHPGVMTTEGLGVDGRRLRVLFNSTALKVIFEGTTAVGVQFLYKGQFALAKARKKVIVTTGIQSAGLLLRSGRGVPTLLTKAGIPVVFANSNVGQHMKNHTIVFALFTANPDDEGLPHDDPQALYTGGAFLNDSILGTTHRDFHYIGMWLAGTEDPMLMVIVALLRPVSEGQIQVINGDPMQLPLVDDEYFHDPIDLEKFRNSLRILQQIGAELTAIDPTYVLESPSPAILADDDLLNDFIKDSLDQAHHWSGQCKMGTSAADSVVDNTGHVFGVKNLIVADASIAPLPNDGNTSSHAYLAGLTIARKLGARLRNTTQYTPSTIVSDEMIPISGGGH